MVSLDEEALICDLAETYHIFDWRSLPLKLTATLSAGLRDDSRIKQKLDGLKAPRESYILAAIADRLGNLIWALSTEGDRPMSFVDMLNGVTNKNEGEKDIVTFESPEEFELARKRLLEKGEEDG